MNHEIADLGQRAEYALRSPAELDFLVALLYGLAMGGRGEYVDAGNTSEHALAALRGVNELVLVVATQLRGVQVGEPAYPSDALLVVLGEKADVAGCEAALAWALKFALDGFPEPVAQVSEGD